MSPNHSDQDGSRGCDAPPHTSSTQDCPGDDCCKKQQRQDKGDCDTVAITIPVDSCCAAGFGSHGSIRAAHNSRTPLRHPRDDVEEGITQTEHVTLKFQGSNCPSCTGKISKAFESMPAVRDLRINTLLLQADFDVDLVKSSVRDVVDFVKKATGRACQRIGDGWHELDVVVSGTCEDFAAYAMRNCGVKDVTQVNRHTFSIKYDANAIGARKLLKALNTELSCSVSLASPKSHDEVPMDIRATAYTTTISWVLTIPILILAWAPLPKHAVTYGIVSLSLATVIQVVVAGPFYPRAFRSLILNRAIDLDLLVVLSTSIAYGFSLASFICEIKGTRLVSGIYFETSALLITLIMMGRLMSDFACLRAFRSGSIKSLQTQSALLVNNSVETALDIDVRLLEFGDTFRVDTSCPVTTDGTIVSGVSKFDESVLTGEATLVRKTVGSSVIAGSFNAGDAVLVQVIRLPGNNTIDEIAAMVEEVTNSKTKAQQTADEVAKWIVPASAALAMLTLVIWSTINLAYREESTSSAILNAVSYAISVLVVCCPCAIAFAVPMVLVIASGVGAKHGVVFRSAEAMTAARRVTHVVFDKTGTLTQRCLSVVSDEYFSKPQSLSAAVVVALTSQSDHPVSLAVLQHLEAAGVQSADVAHVKSVIGKGIEGTYKGQTVRIGNARWLKAEKLLPVRSLLSRNLTVMCVTQGNQLVAVFGLEATLRDEASIVVASLLERGISVSIMSGDEIGAVEQVARNLGISQKAVRARCTPREKQQYVKELMDSDKNTVLFCGDGVNDAAALSQASVGVHMSSGTGTSWTAGDAVLIRPSLVGILVLMDLSRDAWRQIAFNFIWAAVYNVLAILFAAGAFVRVRLAPQYAGLGEAVSVLPVILVPLQLRWRRYL